MLDKKQARIIRAALDGRVEDLALALRDLERLARQIDEQVSSAKRELEKATDVRSKTLAAFGLEE